MLTVPVERETISSVLDNCLIQDVAKKGCFSIDIGARVGRIFLNSNSCLAEIFAKRLAVPNVQPAPVQPLLMLSGS